MPDLHSRYPSLRSSVFPARTALCAFARETGFFGDSLDDFEIAVGEALANAVEHGHREGTFFSIDAYVIGGDIVVEIADRGFGFRADDRTGCERPPSDSPRGFGLYIMRTLMDTVSFLDGGTTIRLTKRVPLAVAGDDAREA